MHFIKIRGNTYKDVDEEGECQSNLKLQITPSIIIFPCRSFRKRRGLHAKHAGHTQTRQDNGGELRMSIQSLIGVLVMRDRDDH